MNFAEKQRLQIKTDENLLKCEALPDGSFSYSMVPRMIVNIAPKFQLELGPVIEGCGKRAKQKMGLPATIERLEHWVNTGEKKDSYEFQYFGKPVLFLSVYAAGTTMVLLTALANMMLLGGQGLAQFVVMLVAGDDVSVFFHLTSAGGRLTELCKRTVDGIYGFEADASQCDSSQGAGPRSLVSRMQQCLGLAARVTTALTDISRARISSKLLHAHFVCALIVISFFGRLIQRSGSGDTTLSNTLSIGLINAVALIRAIQGDDLGLYATAALHYGIKMTVDLSGYSFELSAFQQISFLKGIWYRMDNGPTLIWSMVPAVFLKTGRFRGDPRLLTKEKDYLRACQLMAAGTYACWAQFPQVPLLRTLIQYKSDTTGPIPTLPYRPAGTKIVEGEGTFRMEETEYDYSHLLPEGRSAKRGDDTIVLFKTEIDMEEAVRAVSICIGCDPESFEEYERLAATNPYSFVDHPVAHLLAAKWYG